jgi:DNA-binding NarL/FixJ family response regulator
MMKTPQPSMPSTRVVLVDDHPLYRAGLAVSVNTTPGFVVVAEASRREDALQVVGATRPDLIIVDLRIGKDSGIAVAVALKEVWAKARVLICSAFLTEAEVHGAALHGLNGYILKTADLNQLRHALVETMTRGCYWTPEAAQMLAQAIKHETLAPREREVLDHVALGECDKEIADNLKLSRHTVLSYQKSLRSKLGARNRSDLIRIAHQRGIVFWPDA